MRRPRHGERKNMLVYAAKRLTGSSANLVILLDSTANGTTPMLKIASSLSIGARQEKRRLGLLFKNVFVCSSAVS